MRPPARTLRERVRQTARALGLGPPVRRARAGWHAARAALAERIAEPEPPASRRDRLDNEHLRLLLSFGLPRDANCIDVGAHEGALLGEILRMAPAGRHIAYEPLPHLHAALAARFPGVDVRCAALSDRDEETTFQWVHNMPGMSGLRGRHYPAAPDIEVIGVRTERLDDHLPPGYAPSFVKIDVEGAEMLVLRGMLRTLQAHHPLLVFEYGRGTEFGPYGTGPDEIHDFLTGLGYRIFDLDGDGPYTAEQFRTVTDHWNYVARL